MPYVNHRMLSIFQTLMLNTNGSIMSLYDMNNDMVISKHPLLL